MPRLIDFGKDHGVVSFPDDATDEQIVAEYDALSEAARPKAIQAARLQLEGALTDVERNRPSLEKYLLRSGLALGEQTAGAAKQAVGNITRGLADVFSIPKSDLQKRPDDSNPELPVNVMREAGRSLEEEGKLQRQSASEIGEAIGGGVGPAIAESLAATAGISATALPAAVYGLGPAAVAAALQSYSLNLSDFKETLLQRNPELTEEEAFKQAQVPAALTGVATGVLTRGFGGVERFIEKIAKEGIGTEGIKALLRDAFKSATLEFPEEYGDQLAQGFTEKAFVNPDKPVGEIFNEAGLAGLAGFALGGLTAGSISAPFVAANKITEPSRVRREGERMRREGEARRREVISREVEQGNILQERTPDATQSRTGAQAPGQEIGTVQETDGSLRIRDNAQTGLEAQAGAPLIQPQPAIGGEPVERQEKGKEGLQVTPSEIAVQNVINQVTANWTAPPPIRVVQTSEQFPDSVKADAQSAGIPLAEIPAAFDSNGTVWMAAGQISDPDHAKRLLLHESVGHYGVESVFETAERFSQFMQGVSDRHATTDLGNQIRALYGNDPLVVGKEIVAKLAENPEADPSLWQTIVATVRDWARKVFNLEVTDNDIKVLLSRGRKAVGSGGNQASRGGTQQDAATAFASEENLPDAPVSYKGYQSGFGSVPGFDLYNLADTIAPNLVKGSTVTGESLRKAGFRVPAAEKAKADAARPPGSSFSVGEFDEDAFAIQQNNKKINSGDIQAMVEFLNQRNAPQQLVKYFSDLLDWHRAREKRNSIRDQAEAKFRPLKQQAMRDARARGEGGLYGPQWQSVVAEENKMLAPYEDLLNDITQRFGEESGSFGTITSLYDLSGLGTYIPEGMTKVPDLRKWVNELSAIYNSRHPSTSSSFSRERPASPQTFQSRQQVNLALSDPLLTPAKRAAAEALASVQSSMVDDQIMGRLMSTPKDEAERFAQSRLDYLQDRRFLADAQTFIQSLPEATEDQKQAKELAASVILNHYGTDRNVEREINSEIETDQQLMSRAVAKIGKLTNAQIKSNFLTSLFNRLVKDYRTYITNLSKDIPAAQNAQAQYRQGLANMERRLNDQVASPIAVQKALSAMAQQIPDILLQSTSSNQGIISWAMTSNVLQGIVGNDVRNWMLADDGSGNPALLGYTRLIQDLNSLRDVLINQEKLSNDIRAFEKWFRPSGKPGRVPVKRFAEAYFKFRTSRDRAAKLASAMEKDIEDLDIRIRGNITARQWLQDLMVSPGYVDTVREASKQAGVVVRAIHEGPLKTGLIERDKTVGLWRMRGPITDTEYVADLHPSGTQEANNQGALKAFAAEAREYADTNSETNPLLADEYARLADYIDRFLVHPALNPHQGFTQLPWIQVPGTTLRISADPFGWTPKTIRDVLEKVGGRAALQSVRDASELDTVMKKVEGINSNSEYGYAAQTQAVLKALESHGWTPDQFPQWDERIAERVLAAGQNNLGPSYEVGDVVVGSGGAVLTTEDVTALKMMKKWEDAVLKAAPKHIQDIIGNLGITRKAIASGQWTMARNPAPWVGPFMIEWGKSATDADKLKLLEHDSRFRRVVMGYIGEFNPEFQRMNKASGEVTPFHDIFRLMARTEKDGVQTFSNMDQVLDFMASEMVSRGMAADQTIARKQAQEALMADISAFVKSFQDNVLGRKVEDVWGAVPPAIVSAASARNSFTVPRGNLVAPSTFYSYSRASDGSRAHHVGSLRSLMNLKLLQSGFEMKRALEASKSRMEERADDLAASGMTRRKAMSEMIKETTASRKSSELRFDYLETINALSLLEKSFDELARFEQSSSEHYQHGGVAALLNVFGTLKASLLSSPQAITTNFWSGVMLGPAITHLQTGRIARGITDFVLEPHFWDALYKRLSAMVAGNPMMAKLLRKNAPMWSAFSKSIVNAASDWSRLEEVAQISGMVAPYNLSDMIKNKEALKTTAGRLESEEEVLKRGVAATNYMMSNVLLRRPIESVKATTPRLFDNMVNMVLIQAFDYETDFLKKAGWAAFKNREEEASRSGADYRDLSNPDNILQPGDLRLGTHKALNRYREIFSGMGSLDQVILDFYERTKGMTPEQRREEPLIQDISDHAAVALQYAAITNVATETNRPFLFKGKGSDGVWRNVAGTFMGWPINMAKQLSKAMQSHSKDSNRNQIWSNMLGLAVLVIMLSVSGAWNWEFGDELTKFTFGQSSARIQIENVIKAANEGDVETAAMYVAQALVNTVPYIGPQIGNMLGVSFTGRGNMFDLTSWNPVLGWIAATWNLGKRISQTGDASLPLADYTRQYVPLSRMVINRLPVMQGLVDQQNAVRSLNASAPRDTEIVWGKRTGGDVRYSPANDEVMKLISSAYDAASGRGDIGGVHQRLESAIAAYVSTGRSPEDAKRAVASALSSKEPIRVLTGREMTPEEEKKWVGRMSKGQKADYDRATAAWKILGEVTGRDMSMVSEPREAVASYGGRSYSRTPLTGIRGSRVRRTGLGRRRRTGIRSARRRTGPKISRRRTGLAGRRRLRYALG